MKDYLSMKPTDLQTPYEGAIQMIQIIRREVEKMRTADKLRNVDNKDFKNGYDMAYVDVLVLLDEMEGVGE